MDKKTEENQNLYPQDHKLDEMRNGEIKVPIEMALSTMEKEPIPEHELKNAQVRTWNSITHSINNIKTMHEEEQTQKIVQSSFISRNYKYFGFLALTLVVVLSTVLTTVYLNSREDKKGISPIVKNNDSNNKSPVQFDIRNAAAKRFEELTGITYAEYQKIESSKLNREQSAGLTAPQTKDNLSTIAQNNNEIKEIEQKVSNRDAKTFYKKIELTLNNPSKENSPILYLGFNVNKYPNVDVNKPFTIETWFENSSSKNVIKQNDKLIIFDLYTPDRSVLYRSGKYAIETKYEGQNYFDVIENMDQKNPDLLFIKYILENNENVKEVGKEVVDGKTLTVYEESMYMIPANTTEPSIQKDDFIAPQTNQKTKYYIDTENFVIYKTEFFNNDVLIYTIKSLENKELSSDLDSIFNYTNNELKDIQIKTIVQNVSPTAKMPKLVDFVNNYKIVYLPQENKTIEWIYKYENEPITKDEYSILTQTTDFDPGYEEIRYPDVKMLPEQNGIELNYNQTNLSYNIYSKEPSSTIETLQNETTVNTQQITIKVDGQDIPATLKEYVYSNTAPEITDPKVRMIDPSYGSGFSTVTLSFNLNNLWYEIVESKNTGSNQYLKNGLELNTLTPEEAKNMDSINEERLNSSPILRYGVKLEDISPKLRYLPGSLKQDLNLQLSTVATNSEKETKCDKYIETWGIDCLIEKYYGFRLSFSTSYEQQNSNDSTTLLMPRDDHKFLDFMILDSSSDQISVLINKLFGQSSNNSTTNTDSYKFYTFNLNGKTLVLAGNISQEEANLIYNKTSIDNGIEELSKEMNSSSDLKIRSAY